VSCIRAQRRDLRTQRRDNKRAKATTVHRTIGHDASRADNSWLSNFGHCDGARPLALDRLAQMALAVTLLLTAKLIDCETGDGEDVLFLVFIVPFAISTANRS